MKVLKFTKDNLERHKSVCTDVYQYVGWNGGHSNTRRELITTRDEIKGDSGDVFYVDDWGFFVLESVIPFYTYENKPVYSTIADLYYSLEGFDTPKQMRNILKKLYPDADKLYVHYLKEVFL